MTSIGNNVRFRPEIVPVKRSPHDHLLLLLFAWGILFLFKASTTLNQLSSPTSLAGVFWIGSVQWVPFSLPCEYARAHHSFKSI